MNPALHSIWTIAKDGKIFTFSIVGIWGAGVRDAYRVLNYELKYDHLDAIQQVPAEKLTTLIQSGAAKYWAPEGLTGP